MTAASASLLHELSRIYHTMRADADAAEIALPPGLSAAELRCKVDALNELRATLARVYERDRARLLGDFSLAKR